MHVGGQTLTIWQAGVCEPTVQPLDVTVSAGAGEAFVDVTTGDGCAWTAVSEVAFLHLLPYAGLGPDRVRFAVDANPEAAARTGALVMAGHTETVSGRYELRVQVNGPRPSFVEVAEHLWGAAVDFDGDSTSPDDRRWKELAIERRSSPSERVDIDPASDTPLILKVVASSQLLAQRAAEFLRDRTNGRLLAS